MRGLEYWSGTADNDMNFTANDFTFFVRLTRGAIGTAMYLVNRRDAGVDGFAFGIDATNNPFLTTYQAVAASQTTTADTAITDLNTDVTIAVTYANGTVTSIFYLNGVSDGGAATHINPGDTAGTTTFFGAEDATPVNGFEGIIKQLAVYSDVCTPAEILLMHKGIFHSNNCLRLYKADEGRSITVYNRYGTAATDATYGTNAGTLEWAWDTTRLGCLSLNGVDEYAVSAAAMDISGNSTFVWAGKMMATYSTLTGVIARPAHIRVDVNNQLTVQYNGDTNAFIFEVYASGAGTAINCVTRPSIGDYWIVVGTKDGANATFYLNGVSVGTVADCGEYSGVLGTLALSRNVGAAQYYDVSKPTLCGLVDGALTDQEATILSQRVDQRFGLGLGI